MKKHASKAVAAVLIAAIALSICYAVGLFDGDGRSQVERYEFAGLSFDGGIKNGIFDGYGDLYLTDGEKYIGPPSLPVR